MADNVYDAIVVGSGISGGWAAKELTEKGLKVLLLERGEDIKHVSGYVNANKHPWEFPHRGGRTQQMIKDYPVLSRDYPLNETNLNYWTNEKDCPYVEIKRFDWFRGYHVGGRSLMWGRQSYRWSDFDFEANAKEGIAVDWPIPLVRLRGKICRHQWQQGRFAATARRAVSTAHGTELRGERCGCAYQGTL
jgi:choline dehydrogenase-like flavoprotein